MRFLATLLIIGGTIISLPSSFADVTAIPSALSSRIVTFTYSPNQTYTLYLHTGMVTDIKLPPGEKLVSMALGDTVRWVTQQVPGSGNIFIKPVVSGIETSATLITSDHSYQMMLVSRKSGDWYQEVRFYSNKPIVYFDPQSTFASAPQVKSERATSEPKGSLSNALTNVNIKDMDFSWKTKGKAPFAPLRVFSTHSFLWLLLPHGAPAPVVFARTGGQWGIVNYNRKGDWIIVQGVPLGVELRANGQSVVIARKAYFNQQVDQSVNSYSEGG